MRVSTIIVNWNSKDELLRCLQSVVNCTDVGLDETIVVDNGSRDGSTQEVRAEYPEVVLVENRANLGYARANNQGFERSSGDFIFLLNPDAQLTAGSVNALLHAFSTLPDAGALTGRLVDNTHKQQHYIHAFPTPLDAMLYSTFVGRLLPEHRRRAARRYFLPDLDYTRMQPVPQPPGACLMLRRSVLGGKLMDARFPLFFNDVDLCKRIWEVGYKIYYVPDARVFHTANKGGVEKAGSLLQIEYAVSMLRYFKKHYTRWDYATMYAILVLHYLLLFLASSVRSLLSGKPTPLFARPIRDSLGLLLRLVQGRSFFEGGSPEW